jgi:hypothetical protein
MPAWTRRSLCDYTKPPRGPPRDHRPARGGAAIDGPSGDVARSAVTDGLQRMSTPRVMLETAHDAADEFGNEDEAEFLDRIPRRTPLRTRGAAGSSRPATMAERPVAILGPRVRRCSPMCSNHAFTRSAPRHPRGIQRSAFLVAEAGRRAANLRHVHPTQPA